MYMATSVIGDERGLPVRSVRVEHAADHGAVAGDHEILPAPPHRCQIAAPTYVLGTGECIRDQLRIVKRQAKWV